MRRGMWAHVRYVHGARVCLLWKSPLSLHVMPYDGRLLWLVLQRSPRRASWVCRALGGNEGSRSGRRGSLRWRQGAGALKG